MYECKSEVYDLFLVYRTQAYIVYTIKTPFFDCFLNKQTSQILNSYPPRKRSRGGVEGEIERGVGIDIA